YAAAQASRADVVTPLVWPRMRRASVRRRAPDAAWRTTPGEGFADAWTSEAALPGPRGGGHARGACPVGQLLPPPGCPASPALRSRVGRRPILRHRPAVHQPGR